MTKQTRTRTKTKQTRTRSRTRTATLIPGRFGLVSVAPAFVRAGTATNISVVLVGVPASPLGLRCIVNGISIPALGPLSSARVLICTLPPMSPAAGLQQTLTLSVRSALNVNSTNVLSLSLFTPPTLTSFTPSSASAPGGPSGLPATATVFTLSGSFADNNVSPRVELRMAETNSVVPATAVFNAGDVIASATVTLPGTYQIAISLDDGLSYDIYGTLFPATWPAPAILSAQFADTGAAFDITFAWPTSQPALPGCGPLFAAASLATVGAAPNCVWVGASTLRVIPGAGATVIPSDTLTLGAATGIRARTDYATSAAAQVQGGAISVVAPVNPPPVAVVLSAPSTIGSCNGLFITARESSGAGGRPWTAVSWSVAVPSPPAVGYNSSATLALQAALAASSAIALDIGATDLQAGVDYDFSVTLTSYLGASASAQVTVSKSALALPTVLIAGPATQTVLRTAAVTLAGLGFLASCAGTAAPLVYSWTQLSGPSVVLNPVTANTRQTVIPAGTLAASTTYSFQLTAAYADNALLSASATLSVSVGSQPLQASIAGANRVVGSAQSVALSAAVVDPDDEASPLAFAWAVTQASVPVASGTGATLDLFSLPLGSFTIDLTVSRGSRTATATASLTVIPSTPPDVFIDPIEGALGASRRRGRRRTITGSGSRINPSVPLVLSATVADAGVSLCWVSVNGDLDLDDTAGLVLTSRTSQILKLAPGYLQGGRTYAFTLFSDFGTFNASWCAGAAPPASQSFIGQASVVVTANAPPYAGSLTASPSSGTSLQTAFLLTANDWVDDTSDLPLSYEYQVETVAEPGVFATAVAAQTLAQRSAVLAGSTSAPSLLRVKVIVRDRWGAAATAETTVTVNPLTDSSPSALNSILDNALSAMLAAGDKDATLSLLNNVLQTLNSNVARRRQGSGDSLRSRALSVLNQLRSTTDFTDGDPLTRFAQILSGTAADAADLQPATFGDFFQQLAQLVAVAEGGVSVEVAASQLLGAMSNAVGYSSFIRGGNNTGASDISNTVTGQVATLLAQQLLTKECGERASTTTTDRIASRAQLLAQSALLNARLTAQPGWNGTSASFGLPASLALGTDPCVGSHLITWTPNPFSTAENTTIVSDVVTLRFTDGSGAEIAVSSSDNITITLPITKQPVVRDTSSLRANQNWNCIFYIPSNDTWSDAGCVLVERTADHVVCACSHLTDFATEFEETTKNATLPDITNVGSLKNLKNRMGTVAAAVTILGVMVILYFIGEKWDKKDEVEYRRKSQIRLSTIGPNGVIDTKDVEIASLEEPVVPDNRPWYMRWRRNPDLPPDLRPVHVKIWDHLKTHHLILSYFFRDPRDTFTRPQRVLCFCVIILGEFAVNAAFYGVGSSSDPAGIIAVAVATAIIIMPLSLFLPVLFKTLNAKSKFKVFGHVLPPWAHHIPPTFSFFLIFWFTYILIIYGVSFSKAVENSWLVSSIISLFQDNLIQEPVLGLFRDTVRFAFTAFFSG
eukprot:TRINITY_DN1473_c0_g1_i7.p1 TRINITY_DN1473_c0_g1~~TRINITY_DN1473_c0_g1_i7.p1  ORF type:complete len:1511 (+),score=334.97 TRINITY_DN1473_c0_g1_i7:61-4533(+)